MPFVNGGLFDCLDTFEATGDGGVRVDCFTDNRNDRKKLHVPTKLFFDEEEGLFPIFAHYKFTVEEHTPVEQEVALDPELLGQVFENLLGVYNPETQSAARKATGSYYTPRQIVDYMIDEALIAYFLQRVEPYDGEQAWLETRLRDDLLAYDSLGEADTDSDHLIEESEIQPMIEAIDALKIIDPAVGSGAFPMGVLNKLVLILRKLDPQNQHWKQRQIQQAEAIPDPQSREAAITAIEQVFSAENQYNDYGRKFYLIQNCIYGVDIQPIAVTIAKLRFFISLAIEQMPNDSAADNYGIQPLPNLETKLVAANSLIGLNRTDTQMLLETEDIEVLRVKITEVRERHFRANNRQAKLKVIDEENVCRAALAKALVDVAKQWGLSETDDAFAEAEKIANWDPYDQNVVADFFDAEWMFGVEDGFDVVIGNPPYVRHESFLKHKPALKSYYGDFFTSTADLSVYFYKRGAELARNGGMVTYICTNKFMRGGYGKNLRSLLTTGMSLERLLDFGSVSVFEAAVDTCIVLMRRSLPGADHIFRAVTLRNVSLPFQVRAEFQKQAFQMQTSRLNPDGWTLASQEVTDLLEQIQNTGQSLLEIVDGRFYRGVVTGCNAAFIIDESICQQLVDEDASSSDIIKPLFAGRDLKKWKAEHTGRYLIFTRQGIDIDKYPAIERYLSQYRADLQPKKTRGQTRGRKMGTYKWYEIQDSTAYYRDFDKPKILYSEMSQSLYACYDTTKVFGLKTTYSIPTNDLSLLSILNSRLFDWYARHKFQSLNDPWAGGGLCFFSQYMKRVPIAERTPTQKAELSELVEQILDDPEGAGVRDLEQEIDALVYRLYGLSAADIALIEQTYRDAGMEV